MLHLRALKRFGSSAPTPGPPFRMDDPRIGLDARRGSDEFALVSRRNRSMPHRSMLALLAFTAVLHLGIGAAFALLGLWLVLPFAGAGLSAVACAFWLDGRHAGDYERLALAAGRLRLEVREAEAVRTYEFNPAWVRLVVREDRWRAMRLALRSHGREVEIGRHLDQAGRERFAALLRERLSAGRRGAGLT